MPQTEAEKKTLLVNKYRQEAEDAVARQCFDEALGLYEKITGIDDRDAPAFANTGFLYFQKGDQDKAEQFLHKSLALDPGQREAAFNLGMLYQQKAEYEKALSYFKGAREDSSRDNEVYCRMGQCAAELGRTDDACAFWSEALRLQPDNLEAGSALAAALVEKEHFAEAEDVLRVCLVSHPDEPSLHFILGLVQQEQKKTEGALAEFKKTVTLDEHNSLAFFHLAQCCVELGFLKQAEPFFAKAWKLDERLDEAVLELAKLYKKLNKKDDAAIMLSKWIEMASPGIGPASEEIRNEYLSACGFLEKHHTKKQQPDEAARYAGLAAGLERGRAGETAAGSDDDDVFRVSLKIDD